MIQTRVTGLKETQASLDRMGPALDKEIEKTDREQAARLAARIKSAGSSLGSTAAHVAPSVHAVNAIVEMGGSAYPMAGGAEFGSDIYPQFQPSTGGQGYFFVPTMHDAEAEAETPYGEALDDTLRKVNL